MIVPPESPLPAVIAVTPAVLVAIVIHVGAPEPFDESTCPKVPTDVNAYFDPFEYAMLPAAPVDVAFVPPFKIGKIPETSVVRESAPHVGFPEAFP